MESGDAEIGMNNGASRSMSCSAVGRNETWESALVERRRRGGGRT